MKNNILYYEEKKNNSVFNDCVAIKVSPGENLRF